jgi:AraC-like DNA-binding protein
MLDAYSYDYTMPAVFFQQYISRRPLAEFVAFFWYWRGHTAQGAPERILPMPTVELVINLDRGRAADAGISGPQSRAFIIEGTAQRELLGVHFKSGGAFPFLGCPSGELLNLNLTLTDLWGKRKASELLARVHEAATAAGKIQTLEKWLILNATRPLQHHPIVCFALREFHRNPGLLKSDILAESIGVSQRRFIQLFRDEIGLAPKLFSRVQRFQQAIKAIDMRDTVDWLDLALSCGYFDQAHFIHDFREFSSLTPGQYLGLRTGHLRHVRLVE